MGGRWWEHGGAWYVGTRGGHEEEEEQAEDKPTTSHSGILSDDASVILYASYGLTRIVTLVLPLCLGRCIPDRHNGSVPPT